MQRCARLSRTNMSNHIREILSIPKSRHVVFACDFFFPPRIQLFIYCPQINFKSLRHDDPTQKLRENALASAFPHCSASCASINDNVEIINWNI